MIDFENCDLLITTAKGLEEALYDELDDIFSDFEIPASEPAILPSGVRLKAPSQVIPLLNMSLQCASRVLIVLKENFVNGEDAIIPFVKSIPWESIFEPSKTFSVSSSVVQTFSGNPQFITLKVKDGIVDRFREKTGVRPNVNIESPDVRVQVKLFKNTLSVAIDTTGDSLDKRAYRLEVSEAPLRETIASGLLRLAGFFKLAREITQSNSPIYFPRQVEESDKARLIPSNMLLSPFLLDPFCGSGTFVIEAALGMLNRKPAVHREHFNFLNLFCGRLDWLHEWKTWKAEILNRERTPEEVREAIKKYTEISKIETSSFDKPFKGFDNAKRSVNAAISNAQRAGVMELCEFEVGDALSSSPHANHGFLICNPPYGERIGGEIEALYSEFGTRLKRSFSGWLAYIYSGNIAGSKKIGLRPTRKFSVPNANLEAHLLQYFLYKGTKEI